MTGVKFLIDRDFSYGIDVSETDARLNAGSLILLEPARDNPVGVPTKLTNYASSAALSLTGFAVDEVTIRNTLVNIGGSAERTAKGALHGLYPAGISAGTPRGALSGVMPAAVLNYMKANPTHAYYLSIHAVVTKISTVTGADGITIAGINGTADPQDGSQLTPIIYQNKSTGAVAGGRNDSANTLGRSSTTNYNHPFHVDVAQSALILNTSTSTNSVRDEIFTIGSPSATAGRYAGCPSWALYSLYLEDLTISGQTYAEAHAKSQAVYDTRFGSGGVYANDTWTIPA